MIIICVLFWILQTYKFNTPTGHPLYGWSKDVSYLLCSRVQETVFYWATGSLHRISFNLSRSFYHFKSQMSLFGLCCHFLPVLIVLFVYPQMDRKAPGRQDGSIPNPDVCLRDWARMIIPKIWVLTVLLNRTVCPGSRYVTECAAAMQTGFPFANRWGCHDSLYMNIFSIEKQSNLIESSNITL